MNEKDLKVLSALKELESEPELLAYSAISKKTGIPSSTIRHHITPKLENLGYIAVDRESRPHRIEPLKNAPSEGLDNLERLREKAEELIRDAVARSSSADQLTTRERSPDQASIREKEPAGLAIYNLANDPGFSGKNKPDSSLVHDWSNGCGRGNVVISIS